MKRNLKDVLGREKSLPGIESRNAPKMGKTEKAPYKPTHWNQGLLSAMTDPQLKIHETEKLVVIRDKYPKAKFHFLILPLAEINNLNELTREHLALLDLMHKEGEQQIEKLKEQCPSLSFKLGYHAVPSMSRLHMHLISEDFNSPCLKTKKHWNSFKSPFFIKSEDVIKELEGNGKIKIDKDFYEGLLKKELACHRCSMKFPNMPKLKNHLPSHSAMC